MHNWQIALQLIGLMLNFTGSGFIAYKIFGSTRKSVLEDSRVQMPIINSDYRRKMGLDKALEEATLDLPKAKLKLNELNMTTRGFGILTIGFILQFIAVILGIIPK